MRATRRCSPYLALHKENSCFAAIDVAEREHPLTVELAGIVLDVTANSQRGTEHSATNKLPAGKTKKRLLLTHKQHYHKMIDGSETLTSGPDTVKCAPN